MSSWLTNDGPVVSICCFTYNHVDYLEDAIRGFMGQVTTFPFEVIIRDDASTDGTTAIVRDYAERYPNIIRTIIEERNKWVYGIGNNAIYTAMLSIVKGEFFAMCEGDDYWITTDKLEKQVSLLITNQKATMCVAQTVACINENGYLVCANLYLGKDKDLQFFDDIKTVYYHTSTYLIRTDLFRTVLSKYAQKIEFADSAIRYMLADIGPFALLKEVVSVYRKHPDGIWTSLDKSKQLAWEIRTAEGFYKYFNSEHRRFFGTRLFYLYGNMLSKNNWTFNNKRPIENFMRFVYLLVTYGIFSFPVRLVRRIKLAMVRAAVTKEAATDTE